MQCWSRLYLLFITGRSRKNLSAGFLQQTTDSEVRIRNFRKTFFPAPGCILEGVVLTHDSAAAEPLVTIDRMIVRGNYWELLRHRVHRLTAQGVRISVPPPGSRKPFQVRTSAITIDEVVADGALVVVEPQTSAGKPLQFAIHEGLLRHVGWNIPLTYSIRIHNPEPPGELNSTGTLGPWNLRDPGATPLSGEYVLEAADLSTYGGIAGMLTSHGKFQGQFKGVEISGTSETPDFEVKSSGHPVALTAQFSARLDAVHSDVFLNGVDADFRQTHITAKGSIASRPDRKEKVALIEISSTRARIQDLLELFITSNRSPMSGWISFRGRAQIPTHLDDFLRKIKLEGGFGIGGAEFSNSSTQREVDKLSAGSLGNKSSSDPGTVLTDVTGREELAGGIAKFSGLKFRVPGAAARMNGTFNVITEAVDLRGRLRVDTEISNTQTGVKSLLLKFIQPFFKRKRRGQIVPVRISGTYENPKFGLDLGDSKSSARGAAR